MDKPSINFVQNEIQPQNRKDVVFMFVKAIKDANKNNTNEYIRAIEDFIIVASAEIPLDKYDATKVFKLKPSFADAKKKYDRERSPLLISAHSQGIQNDRMADYLDALQIERIKVEQLLKLYTGWQFDQVLRATSGK